VYFTLPRIPRQAPQPEPAHTMLTRVEKEPLDDSSHEVRITSHVRHCNCYDSPVYIYLFWGKPRSFALPVHEVEHIVAKFWQLTLLHKISAAKPPIECFAQLRTMQRLFIFTDRKVGLSSVTTSQRTSSLYLLCLTLAI
jgi:hypothetical protein